MKPFRALTAVEQLAAHLRREIEAGVFGVALPGVHRLAKALGVGSRSVVAALAQLEHEGVITGQGARRRSRVAAQPSGAGAGGDLKIRILLYDRAEAGTRIMIDLRRRLSDAGHRAGFAALDLHQLGMHPKNVQRFVAEHPADAWVVVGGTEEVLETFVTTEIPAFAFFGRHASLPLAGASVRKIPAMQKAVGRLVELGHRRIVMLAREERRKPVPAIFEAAFLEELASYKIQTGHYNLPDWEDSPKAFHRVIDSLMRHTPPTALLISESLLFNAAQQHLARLGVLAPEHISLICDESDPNLAWCERAVAHFDWDSEPLLRGAVRWADRLVRGKSSRSKSISVADFIEGATVGPVR